MFRFIAILTILILSFPGNAKDGRKLKAYLQTKQFYAPGAGNFLEIHTQFVGYSINYKGVDGGLQGELGIQFNVRIGDSIVASDAYRLNSPIMKDSIVDDFYDVKRFALTPGIYSIDLSIFDLNSEDEPITGTFDVQLEDLAQSISISDILIAESAIKSDDNNEFNKSGYTIIPRIATFYPEELSFIPAYVEFYNTDLSDENEFGVKQTIVNAETGNEVDEFTSFSKQNANTVVPFLKNIDISNLPTGKYILNFTVINREMKELSTQSYTFERSNDIGVAALNPMDVEIDDLFQESIPEDSVGFYLASLIPISKPAQTKAIISCLKTKETDNYRLMIQAFWQETAPVDKYNQWIKYKSQVNRIEKLYANNFQNGFETDRGRVFLQYGPPSRTFVKENSSSEYPYEIWEYNKIGVFSNRKFIFYNPDLVNNAYRLLHSDMVGELKNPNWAYELSRRNTPHGNVDDPNQFNQNSWGNNSREVFGN